ncbi:glyceraldehyde-3-phosphate dehydrogenase/erythrose-4-phosphate dehydrogenase [Streptomyces phaeochromogenes]|jgi:glyceraldehyde-3-phosphate dehydrogenase/erythrose-4-phosphate dehydrogenase|nr:glyceraldehyde-3-phosphate dehydrogenase/erythrose-4-phosphate dehydrogenase [Streptomyces phaeochromogenes]
MTVQVGINGFGRIGRAHLRGAPERAESDRSASAEAADGRLRGILRVTTAPIVSRDVIGDPVKVSVWYDNEWGCSNRLLDLTGTVPTGRFQEHAAEQL